MKAVLEAAEALPRAQQGLLEHVLGFLRGADHPIAARRQLPAMTGDQLLERADVARPALATSSALAILVAS
ncbi:MAG: hypothetical protein ACYDH5_11105 [Acidimicrobiales bacterium]